MPRSGKSFASMRSSPVERALQEVHPGGPQGDGGGYSDSNGRAATSSRHRASSTVPFDGPCAALDEAPPVGPPERTSGTIEGNRGLGQWGRKGLGLQRNGRWLPLRQRSAGASDGRFNPQALKGQLEGTPSCLNPHWPSSSRRRDSTAPKRPARLPRRRSDRSASGERNLSTRTLPRNVVLAWGFRIR